MQVNLNLRIKAVFSGRKAALDESAHRSFVCGKNNDKLYKSFKPRAHSRLPLFFSFNYKSAIIRRSEKDENAFYISCNYCIDFLCRVCAVMQAQDVAHRARKNGVCLGGAVRTALASVA